ncbi:MAG: putative ABC exporter domain-containing protein [Planctomycetota bacterium]
MILPHPGLWLLQKRKFAGTFRKQIRRAKTPKGAALAIIGILVVGIWFSSFLFGQIVGSRNVSDGGGQSANPHALEIVQGALATLALINIFTSLGFRGLFIPKEEIELLFSSPVSRSDIIRYRLIVNFGRSLFGSIIISILAMQRSAVGIYGFVGTFLAMQTLPIVGQSVSIIAGDIENRWMTKAPRWLFKLVGGVGAIAVIAIIGALFIPSGDSWKRVVTFLANEGGTGIFQNPVVATISSIARPWALMITAESAGQFFIWFGVSVVIWIALFEFAARIPVDFRELSLETASDVAKRLNRIRRGGAGGSEPISKTTAGWNVPWIAGRGRFGALTWRKLTSMVRKARTALLTSIFILAITTVILSFILKSSRAQSAEPWITIIITLVGVMYLCNGLRFDFREDLDKMEVLKTCPVPGWQIFISNLLPQTVFVSLLVYTAHIVRFFIDGTAHHILIVIIPATPLITFIWAAVDNIVYLFAPVRVVAGQDTMLQNAGRMFIMMIVRMVAIAIFILAASSPFLIWTILCELLPFNISESFSIVNIIIGLLGMPLAAIEAAFLAMVGGVMIRRFDVAFDRG